jgi:ATP-dependent helicase/nuclease subunit B
MVLRGLLARHRRELNLFRASSRLTGFAQQLSDVLEELQRNGSGPSDLLETAGRTGTSSSLAGKLQDLALVYEKYCGWLTDHKLEDAGRLLGSATAALKTPAQTTATPPPPIIASVWIDGFAEWSPQEQDFLTALLPRCEQATIALCLDPKAAADARWVSPWAVTKRSFEDLKRLASELPGASTEIIELPAGLPPKKKAAAKGPTAGKAGQFPSSQPSPTRFASPVLRHLEEAWAKPRPFSGAMDSNPSPLRVVLCRDPELEVIKTAREICRYVQQGGRYRELSSWCATWKTITRCSAEYFRDTRSHFSSIAEKRSHITPWRS